MTILEAQDLAIEIRYETNARVETIQLGNGEWVVVVNTTKYIWSAADWERVKVTA
jgi:hypothetical protein